MAYSKLTLLSRTVSATDGAQVNDAGTLEVPASGIVAGFAVTTTGAPATYDARAAIEASVDGVNWHQVLRFADITNAASAARYARLPGEAAAAEVATAVSALGTAAAAATLVDEPWPFLVRAVTKLQTLTGGAAPTVTFTITLEPIG